VEVAEQGVYPALPQPLIRIGLATYQPGCGRAHFRRIKQILAEAVCPLDVALGGVASIELRIEKLPFDNGEPIPVSLDDLIELLSRRELHGWEYRPFHHLVCARQVLAGRPSAVVPHTVHEQPVFKTCFLTEIDHG